MQYDTVRWILLACDAVFALASPFLAIELRAWFEAKSFVTVGLVVYALTTSCASFFFLWSFGVTRVAWRFFSYPDATNTLKALVLGVAVGVAVGFLRDRLDDIPRLVPLLHLLIQFSAYVGARLLARRWVKPKASGTNRGNVLLVGCNATANVYARAVVALSHGSLRIAGVLADDPSMVGHTLRGYKIIATIANVDAAVDTLKVHGVDLERIVIAASDEEMPDPVRARVFETAERHAVPIADIHALFGEVATRDDADDSEMEAVYLPGRYWTFKRMFDFAAALSLIVAVAPLFVVTAAVVAFDVGRPLIFWQQRRGRHGRPFVVYKFRSMRGPLDKGGATLSDDERTSVVGRFLRKTRLDELPQLFNILMGHMSFVGPRPLLTVDQPSEIAQRLAVRPGLTGWAQVNGGKLVSREDKRALDLWYVSHASLFMDLRICVLTLAMLVRGDLLDMNAIRHATNWLNSREQKIDF